MQYGSLGPARADDITTLENVVVTASRAVETEEDTLAPVTVITKKEIERSQATSIADLLKTTPGLQIATYGGTGTATGIYLRGTKTAQTLVLLERSKNKTHLIQVLHLYSI